MSSFPYTYIPVQPALVLKPCTLFNYVSRSWRCSNFSLRFPSNATCFRIKYLPAMQTYVYTHTEARRLDTRGFRTRRNFSSSRNLAAESTQFNPEIIPNNFWFTCPLSGSERAGKRTYTPTN